MIPHYTTRRQKYGKNQYHFPLFFLKFGLEDIVVGGRFFLKKFMYFCNPISRYYLFYKKLIL